MIAIYAVTATILVLVFQLLAGLTGELVIILLSGVVLGALPFGIWRLAAVEPNPRLEWLLPLTAALGVLSGVLLSWSISNRLGIWDLLAVPLTAAASVVIASHPRWLRREPCELCPLGLTPVRFECPRCHLTVCSRSTCWKAKHIRCTACLEREVILFRLDETWWYIRVGRRASKGQCSKCFVEAREGDLRECGNCHWPLCKRCWDYENGRCIRCEWVMPNLPPSLARYFKLNPRGSPTLKGNI